MLFVYITLPCRLPIIKYISVGFDKVIGRYLVIKILQNLPRLDKLGEININIISGSPCQKF